MKNYILAETVSGEGYSNPKLRLFTDLEKVTKALQQVCKTFGNEFTKTPTGKKANDFIFVNNNELDEEMDYHRVRIITVPFAPAYLVTVTEPNETEVQTFESVLDAKKALKQVVKDTVWEEDDFDGYDNGTEFGCHSEDGYIHLQIL